MPSVISDECIMCGACSATCPVSAIAEGDGKYVIDADKCIEAILKILHADKRVLDTKTKGAADPMSVLSAMNDSTVTFLARVWVKSADYWPLKFDLNKALFTELPKQGFHFEYPHMNVTLSK